MAFEIIETILTLTITDFMMKKINSNYLLLTNSEFLVIIFVLQASFYVIIVHYIVNQDWVCQSFLLSEDIVTHEILKTIFFCSYQDNKDSEVAKFGCKGLVFSSRNKW